MVIPVKTRLLTKTISWILSLFLIISGVEASSLSFKLTGGFAWVDGGDLNRHLQGWKDYSGDRNLSPYTFDFDVNKIHFSREGGLEFTYSFAPRWRIGLGLSFIQGDTRGVMSSSLALEEDYFQSDDDFGTIALTENQEQRPEYRLRAVPITLTVYHSFSFLRRGEVFFGVGGGYYFGRLKYKERYQYDSDYTDDNILSGSLLQYVDQYSSSGEYTEKSRSEALGFHGQAGLEWKVSPRLHLVFEVIGRWVDFSGWTGDKKDSYSWDHTYGNWGAFTDQGTEEITSGGKLWLVDHQSGITGKSYPRLVFSAEEPRFASYKNVKPAKINGSGLSFRIGIKISL